MKRGLFWVFIHKNVSKQLNSAARAAEQTKKQIYND